VTFISVERSHWAGGELALNSPRASAAPIRWNISSARRNKTLACAAWPIGALVADPARCRILLAVGVRGRHRYYRLAGSASSS
jgi:hypothetical protein